MKRNLSVFRMILLVMVFALATYILHQLLRYSSFGWFGFLTTFVWVILIFALALSQPLYFWGNENLGESAWLERLNIAGYLSFPYVSDMLTLILIRDLVGFAAWGGYIAGWWQWDGFSIYSGEVTITILILPVFMTFFGYMTIEMGPWVRKVVVKDPKIPEKFSGFKVLHLTDIHFGPMMRDRLVKKLIKKIQTIKFDTMVLTGDIVDCDPDRYSENLWGLEKFEAPEGIFYCSGNHEYYWGFHKIKPWLEKAKIQILHNQKVSIKRANQEVVIAGIPDPVSKYFKDEVVLDWSKLEAKNDNPDTYNILLAHQPYLADEAVKYKFNLQFSGHTHAGQFFPWNFLIYFFQKYTHGLYRIKKKKICKSNDDMWLYVNQGTGFWGPPTRLGTYCELALIELRREN